MGEELGWQDPLEPYKPALGSVAVSLVPGLNSYSVLTDPKASTAAKVFAVGGDALAVVGVGAAVKVAKSGAALVKGVATGAEAAEGLEAVHAYSVAFEMQLAPSEFGLNRMRHFRIANQALAEARVANTELAQLVPQASVRGTAPSGWVWQHATTEQGAGRAGILQLVPKAQHTPGSPFWRTLHPLPNGGGGYAEWAIPAGAPRN
jgi:hypothetical protein